MSLLATMETTEGFDFEVCNQNRDQHNMEICIEEHFKCMICLNLVYKPIVQSCGHMFCFWCVHRAMNPKKESACVMCRRPYLHFPRICPLLHSFLLKAAPLAYAAQARETQAMEEREQVYSPRSILRFPKHLNFPLSMPEGSEQNLEHHCEHPQKEVASEAREITSHDFPCALCHELLYRPVVLKCGEVFCESCLKKSDLTSSMPGKCPSCGCKHQRTSINVCLELHHFLEATFPLEYQERKLNSQLPTNHIECAVMTPSVDDASSVELEDQQLLYEMVHEGVGCDSCGMYPIVGTRFQCKDCSHEKISYDLCGHCKESPPFNEGRFNQNHSPQHHMKEVMINQYPNTHNKPLVRIMRISPAMAPLIFNLPTNATPQRRTHTQRQLLYDDFDDYIDCLV